MSIKKVCYGVLGLSLFLGLALWTGCSLLGQGDGNHDSRGDFGWGFGTLSGGGQTAVDWMKIWQDQFHSNYYVFWDDSAGGNHFNTRGKMGSDVSWISVQENDTNSPQSGISCIKATLTPGSSTGWGGVYFLNGMLTGTNAIPMANWGESNNAGVDLTGATELSFWAKGNAGGETVEFICFGVGRNTDGSSNQPYPDANVKLSTNVTLTTSWTEYKISLTGANLSYVLGGFAWVMAKAAGESWTSRTIYIDNIKYNKSSLTEPRFLLSYKTLAVTNYSDLVLRNVAYTYDNALAIIAFLAYGENTRAQYIADALVEAQTNDRYFADGRLRNAYLAGSLKLPNGWTPNGKTNVVTSPGWWDSPHEVYYEDEYCLSTDTGNMAWAILGLLAYYNKVGGSKYLNAAKILGDWIAASNISSVGAGGFTAGYTGWEPSPTKKTYKSTEHNLDLYAAFKRLYDITAESKWLTYATNASNFVMAMWNNTNGHFYAGTEADGITINANSWQIPLDCQSWTLLAFRTLGTNYYRALAYATNNFKISGTWGFDFNNVLDGIWYEGTAQLATAFMLAANYTVASSIVSEINGGNAPSGAMYATSTESVGTGYYYTDGTQWCYFRREHLGATAWAIFSEKQVNAFWYGTSNESLALPQTNDYTPGLAFTLIKNNTEYSVSKGTANTTGAVLTPDYYNGLPVTEVGDFAYCSNMTSIRLPAYLTSINDWCFSYCSSLTNMALPNSVTNIGGRAFLDCYALGSINIPSSITKFGRSTFMDCYALSNIQIAGAITYIDTNTFWYCTNLRGLNLSNALKSLGLYAFFSCWSLTNVTLPSTLTNIDEAVLMYCKSINKVSIPYGVKVIADYLFHGCTSLTNMTIPSGVTNIGQSAFMSCSLLGSLTLPSGISAIRDYTFNACYQLSNITIPTNVKHIGQTAFANCTNIKTLSIPGGVTNIGQSAFAGINVKVISIPSGVTIIPDTAFAGCTSLTNFVIHSGITNIGNCAFQYCTSLKTVYANPTVPPYLSGGLGYMVFVGCSQLTAILVPDGSVTAYKTAEGWSYYSNKIVSSSNTNKCYSVFNTADIQAEITVQDLFAYNGKLYSSHWDWCNTYAFDGSIWTNAANNKPSHGINPSSRKYFVYDMDGTGDALYIFTYSGAYGGLTRLYKWVNQSWVVVTNLPTATLAGYVSNYMGDPVIYNGNLYVSANRDEYPSGWTNFATIYKHVQGSGWSVVMTNVDVKSGFKMVVYNDGTGDKLYAYGNTNYYNYYGGIALGWQYDGTNWNAPAPLTYGGSVYSLCVYTNQLFVGLENSGVWVLNANGTYSRIFYTPGYTYRDPDSMCVWNGKLYVGFGDPGVFLYSHTGTTPNQNWTQEVCFTNDIPAPYRINSMAVYSNQLYLGVQFVQYRSGMGNTNSAQVYKVQF